MEELGKIREAGLFAAAEVLGIQSVSFLDYIDGELDAAHPAEAIAKIAGHLRRAQPDVAVTFGQYGGCSRPGHTRTFSASERRSFWAWSPHPPHPPVFGASMSSSD